MVCLALVLVGVMGLFPEAALATEGAGDYMGSLSTTVAVLIALSVAAERLVEIIKGWIPFLNQTSDDPAKEGARRSILQIMAVLSGIVTALATRSVIQQVLPDFATLPHILALGLLASGGSGFWNSINTYILELKNFQKELAKQAQRGNLPGR